MKRDDHEAKKIGAWLALLTLISAVSNASELEQLMAKYQETAPLSLSSSRGKELWLQVHDGRSCGSCHTNNPIKEGSHVKTGKAINPLSPSTNRLSLTSQKKVRKWLKRNCKWTFGRECTVQEKGDFLTWLRTQ